MKNQTIGCELEFTGLTRHQAAKVVAVHFGATACCSLNVIDNNGRIWQVKRDGSVRTENGGDPCELVTPILTWDDIPTVQEIVRKLRAAGAKVNWSCGLHVHIGAAGMTAQMIRNLVNNVASHQNLLYKALAVDEDRRGYCKPLNERFLQELNAKKPKTLAELKPIWYGDDEPHEHHYDESRYQLLNLHALFEKQTVEFRIFNGTLHAGEVKTAIQLACALVADAKKAKRTNLKPVNTDNEKFAMRTWLTRPTGLALNGDEFTTLRHHLLKHLGGNAAWRFAIG